MKQKANYPVQERVIIEDETDRKRIVEEILLILAEKENHKGE